MRTYRAELAPWRTVPLHEKFKQKALEHAQKVRSSRWGRHHAHETTCPYCGEEDGLVGIVRIGAKEQVSDVPMTRTGYEVEGARDRDREILLIRCSNKECEAAIDPLAYLTPAVFYADHTNTPLFSDDDPVY